MHALCLTAWLLLVSCIMKNKPVYIYLMCVLHYECELGDSEDAEEDNDCSYFWGHPIIYNYKR